MDRNDHADPNEQDRRIDCPGYSRKDLTMRREKDQTVLQVELLETREVMTANTTLAAGVLTINGGPGNDYIEVLRDLENNQLVVRDAGREVFRTSAAMAN